MDFSIFPALEVPQLRLCGLTFELSGRQRQDARPGPVKMYSVPPARAWWPAVGAPLERGESRSRKSEHGLKWNGCSVGRG